MAQKRSFYKVWVDLSNGEKVSGALAWATENGIGVLHKNSTDTLRVDREYIHTLKIRRRGGVGNGLWKGALIGSAVGLGLNLLIDREDIITETLKVTAPFALGTAGSIIGAGIGGTREKFDVLIEEDAYELFLKSYGFKPVP